MSGTSFSYDELDEILRGGGHGDAVGMSAIDGLIAALVAAPSFVHPDEWVPLIFAGKRPAMLEGSIEERIVRTVFNRYNEVSATLSERPDTYRPIFMKDPDGRVIVRDWAVGFMTGVGLRAEAWGSSIILTEHRHLLTPIALYHDLGNRLLPDMPEAERQRRRPSAYHDIPNAVAAIRAICNPLRAAEAQRPPAKPRRPREASTSRRR
jgi:yecA family protein